MCRIGRREFSRGSGTGGVFAGGEAPRGPPPAAARGASAGGQVHLLPTALKSVWAPRKLFSAREQPKPALGLKPPALGHHLGASGLLSSPETHRFFSHLRGCEAPVNQRVDQAELGAQFFLVVLLLAISKGQGYLSFIPPETKSPAHLRVLVVWLGSRRGHIQVQ